MSGAPSMSHVFVASVSDREIAETVASCLATALSRGGAAAAIVERSRRPLLEESLRRRSLAGHPELLVLGAEATLAAFTVDGALSAERFEQAIGDVVAPLARRRPLRLYGDMVDVLARTNRLDQALELEGLWTALGRRIAFSLVCGYRLDLLRDDDQARLESVAATHDAMLRTPSLPSAERVDGCVAAAVGAELLPFYRPDPRDGFPARLPAGAARLLWLGRHFPLASEKVFAELSRPQAA